MYVGSFSVNYNDVGLKDYEGKPVIPAEIGQVRHKRGQLFWRFGFEDGDASYEESVGADGPVNQCHAFRKQFGKTEMVVAPQVRALYLAKMV